MPIELYAFLVAAFLVAMTPGPSLIYVAAFSLRFGTAAGLVSALGVNIGSYVLITIAALGLYPIIQAAPQLVDIIQAVGGLYLLYLGVKMWPRKRNETPVEIEDAEASRTKIFARGVVTTLLNPKDILFYLLFIPTFIPVSEHDAAFLTYFVVLSVAYAFIGLTTKCAVALFAGTLKDRFATGGAAIVNYASALMLGALGLFVLRKAYSQLVD